MISRMWPRPNAVYLCSWYKITLKWAVLVADYFLTHFFSDSVSRGSFLGRRFTGIGPAGSGADLCPKEILDKKLRILR